MALDALLAGVMAFFALERGAEILINRRNSRILAQRGAVWYGPRDGFALILASQVLLFAGTFGEAAFAPWGGAQRPALFVPLALALALAQALRYWCITTLGWRWSIRIVTMPGAPRIMAGPYRFFSHPNYAVVLAEAILLPLAFGAWFTLLLVVPLQLAALVHRIRLENTALRASSA